MRGIIFIAASFALASPASAFVTLSPKLATVPVMQTAPTAEMPEVQTPCTVTEGCRT